MTKLMEDFLSNKWNLYGLQMACGSLMLMVLQNYLSIIGLCSMALCVYLISICQRILGVRFGMLYYEINKSKLDELLEQIRKDEKK